MAQVNFRIDDETKRQAEELFGQMGLTMTSAIMVFIKQSINEQGIPFKVHVPENILTKDELLRSIDDVEHGRNCHYHDLIEVDDKAKKPVRAKSRPACSRRRSIVT